MTASLAFLLERADWMASAACAGADPELWHPDKGGDSRSAKAVCAGCTVREDCLAYALARREPFGVWGGLVMDTAGESGALLVSCGESFIGLLMPQRPDDERTAEIAEWHRGWMKRITERVPASSAP